MTDSSLTFKNRMASTDFEGLSQLKLKAREDSNAALEDTARQFEALFIQTMLKTMRSSQRVLNEDSPFRSDSEDTFQEMLDAQYAQSIGQGTGIGMAKALVQQMSNTNRGQTNIKNLVAPIAATKETPVTESQPAQEQKPVSDFVKTILPYAKKAANVLGLDPKILVAQAALETGWGLFVNKDATGESTHNYFNIKAVSSEEKDAVNIKTTEFIADTAISVNQLFKRYASPESGFSDYVHLIQHSERYAKALDHGGDSQTFIKALQQAGYATDPSYANKVLDIYHGKALKAALEINDQQLS